MAKWPVGRWRSDFSLWRSDLRRWRTWRWRNHSLAKKRPKTLANVTLAKSLVGEITRYPKKRSMEARAFIDQQMRRNDETTSAKIRMKLAKRGILVSSSTVRRSRKQKNYYYSSNWWQWSEQAYVLSFLV